MRTSARLLPLLLAVLIAGCSDSSTPPGPTPTPMRSVQPPPTSSAVPSATPSSRPTPSATIRPRAQDGDVDGDGRADTIKPGAQSLSVTLSSTGKVVTAPVTTDRPVAPTLLGTADVDLDGRVEVFLETARGASTAFATPYRFDGIRLRELQLDGSPAQLGMGGTVTHGEGFRCRPDGLLEALSAESADGKRFTVTSTTYRVAATELVQQRRTSSTGEQGDKTVSAAFSVDCGTVTAGEP